MVPEAQTLLLVPGVLVSLLGSAMLAKPRCVARFQEQMDAIGSTRDLKDVEPAEWNVILNRILGCVVFLIGIYAILGGFRVISV